MTTEPEFDVLKVPSAKMLPAGMLSDVWPSDAMLEFEELRRTGIELIAFDGRPASSTTSTLTTPLSVLGRNGEGEANTKSFDGNPLGVTVVNRSDGGEGGLSPSECAVIWVEPGVVVVVTLAMAY